MKDKLKKASTTRLLSFVEYAISILKLRGVSVRHLIA